MRRAMLHPLSISGISFEHFTGIGNTPAFSALLVSEMNPYEIPPWAGGISHLGPSVTCGISHEIPGHRWDTSWDLGGISQPKSFRSRDQVENDFFRCEELSQSARYPAPSPAEGGRNHGTCAVPCHQLPVPYPRGPLFIARRSHPCRWCIVANGTRQGLVAVRRAQFSRGRNSTASERMRFRDRGCWKEHRSVEAGRLSELSLSSPQPAA